MSARASSGETVRELSVLHLSEHPNESQLLAEELDAEQLPNRIERVPDAVALRARLARDGFDLLIVDLPLPATVDPRLLDDLSVERPELVVVFRWGTPGNWTTEAPGTQLARSVRQALALRADRPQSAEERQALLRQIVRQQQAFLELSKGDLWDFDAAIARITSTVSRVLEVARVSVWELSADDSTLRCLDLFDATKGEHRRSPDLRSFPRYLASLRTSLILAAHDAQQDPRCAELLEGYLKPRGITAMLDAPIRRDGRVVGVVCHEHVGAEPRRWNVLEQCAASSIAGLVARAFEVRDRRLVEERAARLERYESIGALAAGVAHDLNNLLMVLLGNLELAGAASRSPADAAASLALAREAAEAVRRLNGDLLAVGRAERLSRRRVDLCEWLAGQSTLLRAAAGTLATLRLAPGDEAVPVDADPEALSRVLLNLVKNAGEALRERGAVEVSLATTPHAEELGGKPAAVISVRDEGCGMSAETQRHLFEPFFSTKAQRQGHGLGLATAFGLVRQHGGAIRAESELDRGSRFDVLLPLAAK